MSLNIVILAAGSGNRMQSNLPKVLHQLAGVSMLERVVNVAKELEPKNIYVVYGNGGKQLTQTMQHLSVTWVAQQHMLGTGHALQQVLPQLKDRDQVLVLYADVPLISKKTLTSLLKSTPRNALGLVVAEFNDPTGFGRIIRNEGGNIVAIVEHKDATKQQLQIKEINTGILTTTVQHLKEWLPRLKNKNSQKEYYLTDIIAMAVEAGFYVGGALAHCQEEVRGVNNLHELSQLERYYQRQKAVELMRRGVTIMDPTRFDLRGELQIGKDVIIDINAVIEGDVSIGANTTIGPNVVLRNAKIGKNVTIKSNSVLEDCTVYPDCQIGPFARIRPGSVIKQNAHVGNFVEIKNATLGEGSKANHLSYLGDAVIGKNVNIGAGTITCNYDGAYKHKTTIKDGAFIGSNTELVAPITIGEKATIGAGSTITTDAPADQLTIARSEQISITGWRRPRKDKSA